MDLFAFVAIFSGLILGAGFVAAITYLVVLAKEMSR